MRVDRVKCCLWGLNTVGWYLGGRYPWDWGTEGQLVGEHILSLFLLGGRCL
jgi:hypothetical protein